MGNTDKRREMLEQAMTHARTEAEFLALARQWQALGLPEQAQICTDRAQQCRKDAAYTRAVLAQMTGAPDTLAQAAELFHDLSGWRDASQREADCRAALTRVQRRANRWAAVLLSGLVIVLVALTLVHQAQLARQVQQRQHQNPAAQPTLATGGGFTVAVQEDGTGICADPAGTPGYAVSRWTDLAAVDVCGHAVGLRRDGTAVAAGYNHFGQCEVSDWQDLIAVAAGGGFTVGLRSDGTAVFTGDEGSGRDAVSGWKNLVAIAAGGEVWRDYIRGEALYTQSQGHQLSQHFVGTAYGHAVGVTKDGRVVAAGSNEKGQCDVTDWRDIVSVAASQYNTVGLRRDGTVVAAGDNADGACEVDDWQNILQVAAGDGHTVGLKMDGTVVAAGRNDCGQCEVGQWQDIVAVAAGNGYTLGLQHDGTVLVAGMDDNIWSCCNVGSWQNIRLPWT